MKLSKPYKILLGILTVGQMFVGLWLLIWFLTAIIPVVTTGNDDLIAEVFAVSIAELVIWVVFVTIISLAVLVFYLIHASTNKNLSNTMKVVWILLLIFVGSVVEVIYFFMEVVPERSMTARLEQS
jgi:hypothetical protein